MGNRNSIYEPEILWTAPVLEKPFAVLVFLIHCSLSCLKSCSHVQYRVFNSRAKKLFQTKSHAMPTCSWIVFGFFFMSILSECLVHNTPQNRKMYEMFKGWRKHAIGTVACRFWVQQRFVPRNKPKETTSFLYLFINRKSLFSWCNGTKYYLDKGSTKDCTSSWMALLQERHLKIFILTDFLLPLQKLVKSSPPIYENLGFFTFIFFCLNPNTFFDMLLNLFIFLEFGWKSQGQPE